jgi:hypothetical protein
MMSLLTHKSYYNILSLVTRLTQGSLNTRGPNKFNGLVRSPLGVAVDTEKKEMEKITVLIFSVVFFMPAHKLAMFPEASSLASEYSFPRLGHVFFIPLKHTSRFPLVRLSPTVVTQFEHPKGQMGFIGLNTGDHKIGCLQPTK